MIEKTFISFCHEGFSQLISLLKELCYGDIDEARQSMISKRHNDDTIITILLIPMVINTLTLKKFSHRKMRKKVL